MIDPLVVEELIDRALAEDIGFADLTSELVIPADARAELALNARQDIVVAGIDVAAQVFRRRVPECRVELRVKDGDRVNAGTAMGRVEGPARGLLAVERTALNFLQHLSGVATLTAQYVERNHRLRLDDGVLIKDNHISVCGSIALAVKRARSGAPVLTKIEVECDTLEQVTQALEAGADMILLDNMSLEDLRRAVALSGGRVPLEASGGVRLETLRAVAETGVDFISVGRITQSAPAVDIGLDAVVRV